LGFIKSTETKKTGKLRFNDQTKGEEIANSVSHGIPALLSFAGIFVLSWLCIHNHKGILALVSVIVFCASFTLLYLNSCLFHAITNVKVKKVLQILDHCMIYVMIAGSYTPVCLTYIKGFWGYFILSINYLCMIVGIAVNLIDMHKFYRLSQILYLVSGWILLVGAVPVVKAIPFKGLMLLLAGGIFYTLGVIFYNLKDKRYMHFVFHLFVTAGSVWHFLFVVNYLCL